MIHPVTGKPCQEPLMGYRFPRETMDKLLADKRILFGPDESKIIEIKLYVQEYKAKLPSLIEMDTRLGAYELRTLFPEQKRLFQFPKPSEFLKQFLQFATDKDDLILDSFAGSGTTGNAVLALNKQDGGRRRFVLVQMPYETQEQQKQKVNICRNITAERVRRVIQGKNTAPLGGSFSYAKLGPALFGQYRELGKKLPTYDELAKYIFYTETSRDFDKKALNTKTGRIGEYGKTSYYLLYTPNNKEDQALDLKWLKSIEKSEKNRNLVVYCEKIWIHRDDLAKYKKETGRKVRPMLVPFNLK